MTKVKSRQTLAFTHMSCANGSLTISSMNCQGLSNLRKRRDVFHYLRQKSYSVYCLQDTHFEPKMEKYIQAEWGYKCYFASCKSNARGVAILFRNNFEFKVNNVERDADGNYIIISLSTMEKELLLVNIYGPNRDNPSFYEKLRGLITEHNQKNIIVVGDFNLVLDQNIDCHNYKHENNPKAKEAVENMIQELNLTDIWRENNPESRRYTWRKPTPLKQSRLDFFLLSDYLIWNYEDSDILPGYRSDHSLIILKLKFGKESIHNTFWKFNSSLLKDKHYVDEINAEIKNVIEEYADISDNPSLHDIPKSEIKLKISDKIFLDFLLMKIRSKTIAFATIKKRKAREKEVNLEQEIRHIEMKEEKTELDLQLLRQKNQELITMRETMMNGVLLRSKARWIGEGEKITKYFCSLEKRNFVSKQMTKLTNKEGEITDDAQEIRGIVKNFYEELYKARQMEECEIQYLVKKIPKLSEEEKTSLEGNITLEEAGIALKHMKNGKSPGTDGFGAEFFKFFWKEIGDFVIRALNESFREGELSTTQKEGIIICIPKQDKPKEYIKNWRPISLLNTVYKIGSACIANRIKKVLPILISEDQTGFIPNRYMGDNIRLIYDIINYLNFKNLPGMLINLDFEKAFDSVDWQFMLKVLKSYGFGTDICKWIGTFYNNIKSTITVNGQTTPWFCIERGCRQGDPVSPYLFILCAEVLAIMVREESEIKGIDIRGCEHKISQFADDTQLINLGDQASFEKSIGILDKFAKVSGLKLNREKTQIIWLGSKKNSRIKYLQHLNMVWNPVEFKILGVWFTQDLKGMEIKNYNDKMTEVRALFKAWLKRLITPLGRIAVLKSLILSKLIYLWMLLPNPPDSFIKELQKLCFSFIWNKKQDRINRKTVIKEVKSGGLNVPEISSYIAALKLKWINRINTTTHKWIDLAVLICPQIQNIERYTPTFLMKNAKDNIFWKQVFLAYERFYYKVKPRSSEEILAEPVFYNAKIKIGNKVISQTEWNQKGIYLVGDFFKQNGQVYTHGEFVTEYQIGLNFLTYFGCVSSIKKYIQTEGFTIHDNIAANLNAALAKVYSVSKGTQLYYRTIIKDKLRPKCCQKWNEKLSTEIPWDICFLKIHKINDVKLRWFQTRIVHRIIATNVMLKEMGIAANHNCSFCCSERDSIEHMFWRCRYIRNFWNIVEDQLIEKCPVIANLSLTENIILFGTDTDFYSDNTFDLIILLVKQYIYRCKVEKCMPTFSVFKKMLKVRYLVDEQIARASMDVNKCEIFWSNYKSLFEDD